MRSFFVALLALLIWTPVAVLAQDDLHYLTIHQKDGTEASFGFSEKPVITYTDNDLIVKTATAPEMHYALVTLSKISFSETPTSVIPVSEKKQAPVFRFDGYNVEISGVKADAAIVVVATDGSIVINSKADSDGCASVSIAELPEGIYVVKTDVISFKILKK